MAAPDASVAAVLGALARGVLGPGYRPEIPGRILANFDLFPTESERRRLLGALRRLDTPSGALALTGRRVPVSWLSPAAAERLLQEWLASRIGLKRNLAALIIAASLAATYGHPGPEWDRIGYPGPLGPAPRKPRRLDPIEITSDEEISCDVVIVGSGAGGGCAAAHLAEAGLDVVVLEKGGYHSESDFDHFEIDATRNMYLYGLTLTTDDLGVRIIAGSTLGGGTVVNYTTSFRAPEFVLKEWAEQSGIDTFVSGEIDESYDEVSKRLNVNTDSSAAGKRDEVMEEGLKRLGWHVDLLPRAVRGCTQDEACGYCGFGCRIGAKQSTMRTYLEDAARHGARLIVRADARRVLIEHGRATGVRALCNGNSLTVKARAVVCAGGAVETPALLLRSGLGGQVGRYLRLHPGSAAFALFDEDIRMWEGTLQARYSAEFRDRDGGYGPIFETVPVHPGMGSAALPWTSARQHREFMGRYAQVGFCAVLPRDRTAGRVSLWKDGTPRLRYKLTPGDERRITEGVIAAGKVMEAAGAREIYTNHAQPLSYAPNGPEAHDRWAEAVRARGYGKASFFSYHQMGSCRMGTNPAASAIGPDNETHEVKDLYVMDGSTFPTASGVNPMLTIYAIANRAAKKLAARL